MKKLLILGTRGVPARHGGFETFAEKLSLFLVSKGWSVTVYCQEMGDGAAHESAWRGVRRVHISAAARGSLGTLVFDLKSTIHSLREEGLVLILGYNTAVFCMMQRLLGRRVLINMDGLEWRRNKWGGAAKAWFWVNERIACYAGNHLIADNPGIQDHLETRVSSSKISMIPYGGECIEEPDASGLIEYKLAPDHYSVVIARPEPENSLLEIVRAFSAKPRNHKLVVLGDLRPREISYHQLVVDAASEEVLFLGAIYDSCLVGALRYFSRLYVHGHRVGGTNPSLVEALGAGCAVIAHDNKFNRWVSGPHAAYFNDETSCSKLLETILDDPDAIRRMKDASKTRFREGLTWPEVLASYESLLERWLPPVKC